MRAGALSLVGGRVSVRWRGDSPHPQVVRNVRTPALLRPVVDGASLVAFGYVEVSKKRTDYSALPGADSAAYQSVRARPIPRAKRFELGRNLRREVPRASLGEWKPPDDRSDPIAQIVRSHAGRVAA